MPLPLVERRLWVALLATSLAAAAGVAGVILVPVGMVWKVAAGAVLVTAVAALAGAGIRRGLRPLTGTATVTEALRDGDYALRLNSRASGIFGELAASVNALADALHRQSLDSRESGLLLGKILEEIDLPVFAFRDDGVLTLSNPAARRLIGLRLHEGVTAEALGLDDLLRKQLQQSERLVLPGGSGRFLVRRRSFRLGGVPHTLLVLAEVGSVLSAERNEAWQSLVRVMSHEINNSLSPIKSMAETWKLRLDDPAGELNRARLAENLDLIARRAASLSRFVGIYAGLAKLPEPSRRPVQLNQLVAKVCALEGRVPVERSGEAITVEIDPDQIEQALINLVQNAVDAVGDSDAPSVSVRWHRQGAGICLDVIDNGPGPPESNNLFVPFFTTKPDGSGIGLLLVRRIAELHGGWFELRQRTDGDSGTVASLWVPEPAGAEPAVQRSASRR